MESITRTRRSSNATDAYGQPVWTDTVTELQAIVSPRIQGTNYGPDEIIVTDGLTLYLPPATEVLDSDRFTVRGKTYVVDGQAFDWQSGLSSWRPGTVVNVQLESNLG
jgi:hypothetical protein